MERPSEEMEPAPHAGAAPPYFRIVLLALLARVAALLPPLAANPAGPGSDFAQYGLRIAAGDGFGPSALLPPAYPFLLGAVFRLQAPTAHAAALWQAVLGALTTVPALAIAQASGLQQRGIWLTGLLVALFPASLAETRFVTPVPLAACLFTAAAAALLPASAAPGFRRAAASGALLGAALLTRSGVILATVPLVLAAPFASRSPGEAIRSRGEVGLAKAFVLALAILVTIPWSVRNSRVHERPALTETTWALRLRAATIPDGLPFALPAAARDARGPDNLVLSDNDLAFWETAGYLLRRPAEAAGLWARRCVQFASPFPGSDARGADPFPHGQPAFRAAHAVAWGIVLSLLLSWLLLHRAHGQRERALAWAALGFIAAGVLAGAVADARLLSLPLLAVPAARGATGLAEWGAIESGRHRAFLFGTMAIWALVARGLAAG